MTTIEAVRAALLAWYDQNARVLPWRGTRDPYAIWVSEVMLQQTRVETVIPYYARFLERFPTPTALARSSEDDVLSAWSGLGYYRRARLLHAGVREVVAKYGGRVPEDAEARRALPGVGAYTCGAIGSIAFDRPEPLVDGNVARVLSRLALIDTPLGRADTDKRLWAMAAELVRGARPGALNQALMELGATVCTPRAARCESCPLRGTCGALASGRVDELPVARAKRPPKVVRMVAVVASDARDPRAIFFVRGGEALFGGLHGLPAGEGEGRRAAEEALRDAGVRATLERAPAGEVLHVLTHRRLHVEVWRAANAAPKRGTQRARSLRRESLADVGTSALTHKVLACADDARPEPL
jgi:A/G-specific adenine glycosylase